MGEVRVSPLRQNGLPAEEGPHALQSRSLNPCPSMIGADNWLLAEKAVERIIQRMQPTKVADQRRRKVVEYVRSLIKRVAYAEIFPFGSVPLKTYLPDGDIDLTAIEPPRSEEHLAKAVLSILQAEERNRISPFEVKDVQYIQAEVKLVKCLVQNTVVDISFQQVGGLCTLCFLEKVDRIIGKNHLFKRSIILIKSWCYYESRILGAHHGLISTYALEILILYIFRLFHPSLDGPLEVLYRFLDYFSLFDWDNYVVSLNGPLGLNTALDISSGREEINGFDSLLSRDFLKKCEDEFAPAFRWSENTSQARSFVRKHLNIIDPLKANNNLGRSVNKGNFFRIRSAFTFGARKLGRILMLPREKIDGELCKFFTNTLDRHGGEGRSETQSSPLSFISYSEPDPLSLELDAQSPVALDFQRELFEDMVKLRVLELGCSPPSYLEKSTEDQAPLPPPPPSSSSSSSTPSSSSSSPSSPKVHPSSEDSGISDLTGDYKSHMRNLLCAVGCLEKPPPASYPFYGGLYPSHMSVSGIMAQPFTPTGYYPLGAGGPIFFPGPYGPEEHPRTRGTGTYFPNVSRWAHRERRSSGRGRGHSHSAYNNRRDVAAGEKLTREKVNGYIWRRPVQSDGPAPCLDPPPPPPVPEAKLEVGFLRAVELEGTAEGSAANPPPEPPISDGEKVNECSVDESGCRLEQAYHLKNDEDFPPLGGLTIGNR